MKKIVYLLSVVAVVATMSLVSCGGGSSSSEQKDTTQTTSEVTSAPVNAYAAGEAIYNGKGNCHTCHQKDGKGIAGTFPPLAGADYLLADKDRAVAQTINGAKTPIVVNGVEYKGGVMPASANLTDEEVRDVVNYILNSWGNAGGEVTVDEVVKARTSK